MLRSSLLVTFFAISGSALGFLIQLMLARQYGIDGTVDAYFFAISWPTFIAGLLAAILSFDLVPYLIAHEANPSYHARLMGSILVGVIFLALVITVLGRTIGQLQILALPTNSLILAYEHLDLLIGLSWLASGFQIINSCLAAMLNSVKRYIFSAFLSILPYLGTIFFLIGTINYARIEFILIGLMLGTLISILISMFLLRKSLFPLLEGGILWKDLSQIALKSPLTAIAMSSFSAYAVVDAYWAPKIGSGALSSLGYAQRLIIGLGNLAVAGASAVVIPHIAELNRKRNFIESKRLVIRTEIYVGLLAIIPALLFLIFAEPIVRILFARGAFKLNEIIVVSGLLRHMSIGMVAMLLSVISLRILFCFKNTGVIAALVGFVWIALYFLLSMLWYPAGVLGIGNAYSLSWLMTLTFILIIIFRKFHCNVK
jgi:putative peptidoglycan lipid II flippase